MEPAVSTHPWDRGDLAMVTPAGRRPPAQAAIIDYGGVMAVSPIGRIHDLADELGVDRDVVVNTIFGGHGDGTDNPYHEVEAGWGRFDDEFAARMQARFAPHGVHFDLPAFVS